MKIKLEKLIDKITERIGILKENKESQKYEVTQDDYPYDFDIKCQKEFLIYLKQILD